MGHGHCESDWGHGRGAECSPHNGDGRPDARARRRGYWVYCTAGNRANNCQRLPVYFQRLLDLLFVFVTVTIEKRFFTMITIHVSRVKYVTGTRHAAARELGAVRTEDI